MKPFIGLDGEGFRNSEGVDLYNLLAASDGSYVRNDSGLTTKECFNYLFGVRARNPDSIMVGFAFGYDTNNILRGLPYSAMERLSRTEFCYLFDKAGACYRVEYIAGKKFVFSKGVGTFVNERGKHKLKFKSHPGMRIVIYDTWGFFQSSFVAAIKQFDIATPSELGLIASMKLQRGEFTQERFSEILAYNNMECELLVRLMDRVRDRMESVDLFLDAWHGAGAVGSALMKREGVKNHIVAPKSQLFESLAKHAYFGGRVQCLQNGEFKDVYTYDIVSAYPSINVELPSLQGLEEERMFSYEPGYPLTIWEVEWDVPRDSTVTPFPFRSESGAIDYPYKGRGYYWDSEVDSALKVFKDNIRVISGYRFNVTDINSRPFSFIRDMFAKRRELKRNGDHAQICLKLGMNSGYGKFAQSIGRTPFQSFIYAGMITAGTRAMMLEAASQNPSAIVSFATDGICSRAPLQLKLGIELGEWEDKEYVEAFVLKSGIYRYFGKPGEKDGAKTRGINGELIDWDLMRSIWREEGLDGWYTANHRQFIGMKSSSDRRLHCSWVDEPRTLEFYQPRYEHQLLSLNPLQYRLIPPTCVPGVSAPYKKRKPVGPGHEFDPSIEFNPSLD